LDTYSHPRYRNCAKIELLEDAIINKKYPFDSSTNFNIEEIKLDNDKIPNSLRNDFFKEFRKMFFDKNEE
jgi:hypothetical protein